VPGACQQRACEEARPLAERDQYLCKPLLTCPGKQSLSLYNSEGREFERLNESRQAVYQHASTVSPGFLVDPVSCVLADFHCNC